MLLNTVHSLLSVFGKVGNEKVGNGSGSPKKVGNEMERSGMVWDSIFSFLLSGKIKSQLAAGDAKR